MLFLISPILYCLSSIYLFFVSCIQYPISCIRYTLSLEETFSPDIGPLTHWIVCTGNKGDLCFIFLLSVCNVLLPLECAVKFWHSACFILNFLDTFCNFPKTKHSTNKLVKKTWNMVIISIRKNQYTLQFCDFSKGYEEWKCLSSRKVGWNFIKLEKFLRLNNLKLNIDKTELIRVTSSQQLSANGTESLCLAAKNSKNENIKSAISAKNFRNDISKQSKMERSFWERWGSRH